MIKQIKEKYNIKVNNIVQNNESTDGNVYIIISDNDKYIMKIYNDKKHALSMVDVHNNLKFNGVNVPDIILNKNGDGYTKFDTKKYCVLYSFMQGNKIADVFENLNSSISIELAREIKKIHNITLGENKFNLNNLPFDIDKSFRRYSLLHFDLTRNNIFYNDKDKNKIGFIDFDDAKYGPTIVDVSIVISLLYFSKSRGFNKNGLKAFLDEYYDDESIKEEEVPFLKEYAIKWITYILNNNNFNSSITNSFEIRKKLIESEMKNIL